MNNRERRARAMYEIINEGTVPWDECSDNIKSPWLKAADAIEQSDADAGMVTVPREPIETMVKAGGKTLDVAIEAYEDASYETIAKHVFCDMRQAYEDSDHE